MDRERATRYPLRRRAVVEALLKDRGELLVVTGLGAATWDATATGDHALNFPLWGAMGGAAMTGLGLSLAQPGRRVLVITGDGEMLMGLGALAAIATEQPANLAVVVLDNERYGETGMQVTATAATVDLAAMAGAAGWPVTGQIEDQAGLEAALPAIRGGVGPVLYDVKIKAESLALVMPPKDGGHLKDRFRQALLGQA